MKLKFIDIKTDDKIMRITYRQFQANHEKSKYVKILCHGLGGHSNSFCMKPIIEAALSANYDIISLDWLYHGCSSITFQQKPTLDDMLISLDKIIELTTKEYKTIDIIGHSMGAIFAICYGIKYGNKYAKKSKIREIIAMSPGFHKAKYYEEKIARTFGVLTPLQYGHSMTTHSLEWTDNIDIIEASLMDPLEVKYIQDCILVPLFDAKTFILKNKDKQKIRTNIIWSTKDPIIDTDAIAEIFDYPFYYNMFQTDIPYHNLCTTLSVGEHVCKIAIGEIIPLKVINPKKKTNQRKINNETISKTKTYPDSMFELANNFWKPPYIIMTLTLFALKFTPLKI